MTSETARPGAPAPPARPDPGGAAHDGAPDAAGGVDVRRVATLAEYHECVAIQRETWGADFSECVPATILLVAQKLGGVVAGAFTAGGRMLGFVFGMAGVVDGRPTHWSDMLAVRPEARGAHLGERLKRCQRELARAAGAEAMYWTFDPLVARNAHLNLARLGARAVEYVPNMYGADTGSPLHGGLPTDRLVARWDLGPGDGAPRDGAAAAGGPRPGALATPVAPDGTPTFAAPPPGAARVRISVPHDVDALAPALRAAWRAATREAFLAQLRRGYAVTAFRRAAGGDLPYYELERAAPPPAPARPAPSPRDPA
jgi:predicted GNAT superfamily acetyltransferase